MSHRSSLLIFFFIIYSAESFSQSTDGMAKNDYLVPGPTAASLGKYGDVPVNYNSGIPNISIPIYEIKEGNISLPVSLSYHAGGIKVQEEATPVGLGWSLNVGGAITRIVGGIADESLFGYFEKRESINAMLQGNINDPDILSQMKYDLVKGRLDGEPDIFICNVGGMSFKFAMNRDGYFETFPVTNYKISFHKTSDDVQEWTIVDDNGNHYEFGGIDNAVKLTEVVVRSQAAENPTSWFIRSLTPVTYAGSSNYQKKILFHYIANLEGSIQTFQQFDSKPIGIACNTFPAPIAPMETNSHLHRTAHLSYITWNGGQITISQTKDRMDNPDLYKINSINIADPSGTVLQKCLFEYGYFAGQDNNGRLKLSKLILGADNAINDLSGEVLRAPAYQFEYNQEPLPDINSRGQDIWGYCNSGYKYQNLFPSFHIFVPSINQVVTYEYPNIRAADPSKNQMGMLRKIIYPTGGWTEFEFETNTESGFDLDKNLVNQPKDAAGNFYFGGLRIKRIKITDPFHPDKISVKRFDYTGDDGKSSGRVADIPLYAFIQDRDIWFGVHAITGQIQYQLEEDVDYVAIRESSIFTLANKTNCVSYNKVTVYNGENGENGKDEFYFNTVIPLITNENTTLPFTPLWQAEWRNGLSKEIHYKNENGNYKKVSERELQYSSARYLADVLGVHAAITKLVTTYHDYDGDANYSGPPIFVGELAVDQVITLGTIYYETDHTYVSSEITRNFASDDETKFLATAVSYETDPVSLQTSRIISRNSEDKEEIIRKTYSGNYNIFNYNPAVPIPLGIHNLREHNILGAPVEETKAVDGFVVHSSLTTYSPEAPSVLRTYSSRFQSPQIPLDLYEPFSVNQQNGDWVIDERLFKVVIEYTDYDDNGNVLIQKLKDGHAVAALWDYRNSLAVAEIKLGNADHDIGLAFDNHNQPYPVPNFAYTSFEGDNNGYWQGVQPSGIQLEPTAPMGIKAYELSAGSISHNFERSTNYYLYFWKKTNASVYLSLDRPNSHSEEVAFTCNGWQLMKITLTDVQNVIIYGSGLIDEVRLFPVDSRISTATYIPGLGPRSQADLNGRIIYYYYDELARLFMIKDMEGNIIKTFEYQFQK
jgi:hypothetical protein